MDKDNKYTKMQEKYYRDGTSNHGEHNNNPDYWNILIADVQHNDDLVDTVALDFGCGKGRNVTNMLEFGRFSRVDGVDISSGNIEHCKKEFANQNSQWFQNDGVSLSGMESDLYSFVMSTIVFQHIAVHKIRYSLMKEIFRVMKSGGIFSFQMGFTGGKVSYFDNFWEASGTNSECDTSVVDATFLVNDLEEIGFTNITHEIRRSHSDHVHPQWIYVRCQKP